MITAKEMESLAANPATTVATLDWRPEMSVNLLKHREAYCRCCSSLTQMIDSIRRRGAQAVEGAVRKQQGHAFKADQCRKHGQTLLRWTGEDTRYKGADVDIRLLGWLCAHCFLFAGAHVQITSMTPPGAMDGVVWGDIPDVVWRAINR